MLPSPARSPGARRPPCGLENVRDESVTGPHLQHEDRLDARPEDRSVHRAVDEHRCGKAMRGKAGPKSSSSNDRAAPKPVIGSPFGARPRRCAILVVAPVSSMKTLFGIEVKLAFKPGLAGRHHISALLLGGMRRLFVRDPASVEEAPARCRSRVRRHARGAASENQSTRTVRFCRRVDDLDRE